MPTFIIPFLKGILPFLWKHKVAIGIAAVALIFWLQKSTIQNLKQQNSVLTQANAEIASALKTETESKKRQIEAIEKERSEADKRNEKYQGIIDKVRKSDETIKCPVPDFVRDAIDRM